MKITLGTICLAVGWLCMKLGNASRRVGYSGACFYLLQVKTYVWQLRAHGYSERTILNKLKAVT
jgi:hypothetical protein